MLGSGVLSLTVFCLLQCAVSGEPSPDFSLRSSLYGTSRVSGAIGDTRLVVAGINANLYITLNSSYPGLAGLLNLTQEVGSRATTLLRNVLDPLGSLAPSRDPDDVELFDEVSSEISRLQSFISTRLVAINSQLNATVHGFIPARLTDVFGRVVLGLQELSSALGALKAAVKSVRESEESSEEVMMGCPVQTVRAKLVYRVVYAVRTLRAYLPAITYTLTTTVENVAIADRYIVRLSQATVDVQAPMQYLSLLLATTNSVFSAVRNSMLLVIAEYNKVTTELTRLTNLSSLMAFAQVGSVMQNFNNALMQVGTAEGRFNASLLGIVAQLELVLQPDMSTPMVSNSEVVATLVKTLISSGPYARFCFYKFSELLLGLTNAGLVGVEECISREMVRLNQLRFVMQETMKLLVFDLEDFTTDLGECNLLVKAARREACITAVAGYYNTVTSHFLTKFNNLYGTGVAEANASKFRLSSCVKVIQFKLVDGTAQDLNTQIQQCALTGPVVVSMAVK